QGMALRDRLPQQLHERRVDAWVRDSAGREQELQGASTWARNGWDVLKTWHDAGTHRCPGKLVKNRPRSPGRVVHLIADPVPPRTTRARDWRPASRGYQRSR